MKYKLYRRDFEIWKHNIYVLPTFRLIIDDMIYLDKNISIEFHFLSLHARLLFLQGGGINNDA